MERYSGIHGLLLWRFSVSWYCCRLSHWDWLTFFICRPYFSSAWYSLPAVRAEAEAALAEKIDKVLTKLAFPLLLVLITVFYIQHHRTILENIGVLGLCVTALILVAIGCSSLLSRLVKNNACQRRTVIIEVGMQNAAQAIAIASSPLIFANEVMAIPAILYSLMMNIVLLTYVGVVRHR